VTPSFPVLEPLHQKCEMVIDGTANVVNPLSVPLAVSDLNFQVWLHDDKGEVPLYPPLPPNSPMFAGTAKMLHSAASGVLSDDGERSGVLVRGGSTQVVHLRLATTNWELCFRTAALYLRRDVRVDLRSGHLELLVDASKQYGIDFEALNVQAPIYFRTRVTGDDQQSVATTDVVAAAALAAMSPRPVVVMPTPSTTPATTQPTT